MVLTRFQSLNLSIKNYRTYMFGAIFIMGNIILPQLCHLIPDGGKILLPIYFFTLIASYKFGLKVGLLTAILSPLCNNFLFGMPPAGMLPVILIKSSLLAFVAAFVARKSKILSVFHVLIVVIAYQVMGGFAEWGLASDLEVALQDFRLGFPGMFFQVIAGWALLKLLAGYGVEKF